MDNLFPLGQARLVCHPNELTLIIDWQEALPRFRQLDITLFLLELFRQESCLDAYRRISQVSKHLYCFEIIERAGHPGDDL
jgi:hypothetical protein